MGFRCEEPGEELRQLCSGYPVEHSHANKVSLDLKQDKSCMPAGVHCNQYHFQVRLAIVHRRATPELYSEIVSAAEVSAALQWRMARA